MQRGVNARGQLVPEEEGRNDVYTYISKRGVNARGQLGTLESEEVCVYWE